jgi:hypothetical protein
MIAIPADAGGLPTMVVLERRPGIVTVARALADSRRLRADVELNALTTAVRFSRIPTILN